MQEQISGCQVTFCGCVLIYSTFVKLEDSYMVHYIPSACKKFWAGRLNIFGHSSKFSIQTDMETILRMFGVCVDCDISHVLIDSLWSFLMKEYSCLVRVKHKHNINMCKYYIYIMKG
jgi:hypothetical protein